MTPERKKQIEDKLRCADVWDRSKIKFHKMLVEAMVYISSLEAIVELKTNEAVERNTRDFRRAKGQ